MAEETACSKALVWSRNALMSISVSNVACGGGGGVEGGAREILGPHLEHWYLLSETFTFDLSTTGTLKA